MWTIDKLSATNVASFKSLEFQPKRGVTTLIFGQNLDNADNQPSNGSGKSALIEAIALALTGDPLRKVKIDEIIRDDAEEMNVSCVLSNIETKQKLEIIRQFSRKSPQSITVILDGNEQVQATVNDYCRFILELIGITKDEFYSYFVLTETKYQSFFAASDKDKKAIINKFSNAVLVDQAIDAVAVDMEPVGAERDKAQLEVSRCEGALSVIQEQILKAVENEQAAQAAKEEQKKNLTQLIADKRAQIRQLESDKQKAEGFIKRLNEVLDIFDIYEADDKTPFETLCTNVGLRIHDVLPDGRRLSDWNGKISEARQKIAEYEARMKSINDEIASIVSDIQDNDKKVQQAKANADDLEVKFKAEGEASRLEMGKLYEQKSSLEREYQALCTKASDNNKAIHKIKMDLTGTVTCPKCAHRFVVGNPIDVEEAEAQLKRLNEANYNINGLISGNEQNQKTCADSIVELRNKKSQSEQKLVEAQTELGKHQSTAIKLSSDKERLSFQCDSILGNVETLKDDLAKFKTKLFDEAFEIIEDEIEKVKHSIDSNCQHMSALSGMIDTYKKQIEELDTHTMSFSPEALQKELNGKEADLAKARETFQKFNTQFSTLDAQSKRFVRFKSVLANTKITALSQMLNGILEQLGSDLRVRIDGFKVLKNGSVRDKITVAILRNGIEFGSYFKLSKGERARIDTACIVAMSRLINANCENGRGLDLLVMDEILNGVDELGLVGIYEALNRIQVTTIVVSHNPITQSYPHTLTVTKENGISTIINN